MACSQTLRKHVFVPYFASCTWCHTISLHTDIHRLEAVGHGLGAICPNEPKVWVLTVLTKRSAPFRKLDLICHHRLCASVAGPAWTGQSGLVGGAGTPGLMALKPVVCDTAFVIVDFPHMQGRAQPPQKTGDHDGRLTSLERGS